VNTYLAGTDVTVSVQFTVAGVPSDPSTVTLRYQPYPGADITEIDYPDTRIIRDSEGAYHSNLDTTGSPGDEATYVWVGTGDCQAAAEGAFLVKPQFS
jgi:hypothetical protein